MSLQCTLIHFKDSESPAIKTSTKLINHGFPKFLNIETSPPSLPTSFFLFFCGGGECHFFR